MCVLSHFNPIQFCDPMDCSLPGSSVHGILQARILQWVAMPSSRGSSWPRDQTHISCGSCTAGGFFTTLQHLYQMILLSLISLTSCILFFIVTASVYILINTSQKLAFILQPHLFLVLLIITILTVVIWYLIVLNCIFQLIREDDHVFTCLLTICMSSLKKIFSDPLPIFNRIVLSLLFFF